MILPVGGPLRADKKGRRCWGMWNGGECSVDNAGYGCAERATTAVGLCGPHYREIIGCVAVAA